MRDVPATFGRAIRPPGVHEVIDVDRARRQHAAYCATLERIGLELLRVPADDRFPDCCFVEDTAVVLGELAIIAAPGASTRRGETAAVEPVLGRHRQIRRIREPGSLDGGDVLRVGRRVFVGLSSRTNAEACAQLGMLLEEEGLEVVPVEVRGILHLKSACTHLGDDLITWLPGHLDESAFSGLQRIVVSADEAHAANCLALNGLVLVPAGAPRTRRAIEGAGLEVIELDISEARKAGGGLTCSAIAF